MRTTARYLLLAACLPWGSSTVGQSQQEVEIQLESVRARIETLQAGLKADLAKKDALTARLAETQRAISASSNALQDAQQELRQKRTRLAGLEAQQAELLEQASVHRDELSRQAVMALASARRPAIQVLFSQTSPAEFGRAITYLNFLSQARSSALTEATEALDRLAAVRVEIDDEITGIQAVQATQQTELARLEDQKSERTGLLRQLAARVTTTQDQLHTLEEDASRLELLLEELMAAFSDIPEGIDEVDFASLKSKLPWPVEGRIRHGFGQRRQAEWKWQGIVLSASAGSEVRSIAHGRIAFADWLRGYGLLIIVDHGSEFHSLYGFNDAIYRDVGDWVEPGEPLAGVGASGGQTEPGLYFELRKQGQPVDPVGWLIER